MSLGIFDMCLSAGGGGVGVRVSYVVCMWRRGHNTYMRVKMLFEILSLLPGKMRMNRYVKAYV